MYSTNMSGFQGKQGKQPTHKSKTRCNNSRSLTPRRSVVLFLSDIQTTASEPTSSILSLMKANRSTPVAPSPPAEITGKHMITTTTLTQLTVSIDDAAAVDNPDNKYVSESKELGESSNATHHMLSTNWAPCHKSHVCKASAGSTPYIIHVDPVDPVDVEEILSIDDKLFLYNTKKKKTRSFWFGCI
jgi:hypothetical protein